MTDRLDGLFAGLRAEVLPEVRPPGVAAARRTVRRRRVAVSAVAVVVAAGAVLAGALPGQTDKSEMSVRWAREAAKAVGPERHDEPVYVLTGTGPDELRATHQVVGGYYTATVACAGHGYVTVTLWAGSGPGDSRTVAVKCDASVPPITTFLTVPGMKTPVDVRVLPDDSAYDGVAVACRLERE